MNLIAIVIIAALVTALLIKSHKAAPALVSGVVTLVLLFARLPRPRARRVEQRRRVRPPTRHRHRPRRRRPAERRTAVTDLARHLDGASTSVALANHATHGAPLAVTDAYDVVGALDELLHRLPQLVGFLVRSTERADPGDYFDDRGDDPAGAIADASHALALVVADLDAAGAHATNAHNHLGHLGRLVPED